MLFDLAPSSRIAKSNSRAHWTLKSDNIATTEEANEAQQQQQGQEQEQLDENASRRQSTHRIPSQSQTQAQTQAQGRRVSIHKYNETVRKMPEGYVPQQREISQSIPRRPPQSHCMPVAPLSAYAPQAAPQGGRRAASQTIDRSTHF